MTLLALTGVWYNLGMMAFFGVCLLLILTVMIQKPQGGGLSAAFGASSGSGQTAFGTKTGDALTWATIILFGVWILVATFLNLAGNPGAPVAAPSSDKSKTPATAPADDSAKDEKATETTPAPQTPPAATPNTPPANTPADPAPGAAPAATPPVTPPASTPPGGNPTPAAPVLPPANTPPAAPK